jgi:hypothetical protein
MNLAKKLIPLASTLVAVGFLPGPAAAAAPPETTISGGPANGAVITDSTPTFSFQSTAANATFSCRLGDAFDPDPDGFDTDPLPFQACGPGSFTAAPLDDGNYRFEVYASTQADAADPTPASRQFTVDSAGGPDLTPPVTTITSGPAEGSATTDNTPTFAFRAADTSPVTFMCTIDHGALEECASPFTTSALSTGQHTFAVRGLDDAGNLEDPATRRTFTVGSAADTVGPKTSITRGPKHRGAKRNATLRFSANEQATFECKLAGKKATKKLRQFAPCTSPRKYKHLKRGRYTFRVRGTDSSGNVGNTARYAWKVKSKHRGRHS